MKSPRCEAPVTSGRSRWTWWLVRLSRRIWFRAALFAVLGIAGALVGVALAPFIPPGLVGELSAEDVADVRPAGGAGRRARAVDEGPTGCVAHPEPIVDLKGIDPEVFQTDLEECEVYAEQVSIGEASAKGAVLGTVVGAAAGAIGGNAGAGAGYGGIYGATTSGMNAEREKQIVFARCLEGRGYRVLNSYAHSVPGVPGPVQVPGGRYEVFESL